MKYLDIERNSRIARINLDEIRHKIEKYLSESIVILEHDYRSAFVGYGENYILSFKQTKRRLHIVLDVWSHRVIDVEYDFNKGLHTEAMGIEYVGDLVRKHIFAMNLMNG